MAERYEIRCDVEGDGFSRFTSEYSGMDKDRFVPVPKILALDPNTCDGAAHLGKLAERAKSAGYADDLSEEEVLARLARVAALRQRTLLVNSVSHDFRDVLEIFDRLNSRGIRFRWLFMRTLRKTVSAALGGTRDRAMRNFHRRKPG